MRLTMGFALSATLECKLCRHLIIGPPFVVQLMVGNKVATVHLGQIFPNFCPLCGQPLPEGLEKDRNFRRRLRRFIRRLHGTTAQ